MAEKYLPVSHFLVDWGGARLGFSEVSGLEIENSVIEYREGSSPENKTIKMPGLTKFGNIVLKRGIIAGDNDFFAWFNTTQLNQVIPGDDFRSNKALIDIGVDHTCRLVGSFPARERPGAHFILPDGKERDQSQQIV